MGDDSRERARQAIAKPAPYGADLDLTRFVDEGPPHPYVTELWMLPAAEQEDLLQAGVEPGGAGRAGSFLQKDHSVVHARSTTEGLEVMSITEAMARYEWLRDYAWKAVPVDADRYTARAELHGEHGYFIRALPGVRSQLPVQACLYLAQEALIQEVHNIIVVEEGAELHVITGCTTAHGILSGLHIGISEFFVKKGALLSFTMVHNWAEEVAVRPRTGAIVGEGATFLSNYVCLRPVRDLQMYPTAYLEGAGATARFHSILVGQPGSHLDVGSRIVLRGPGSRGEMIARSITRGGEIINRGHLVGEVPECRGHLECRGLMLGQEGSIYAVPELEARVNGVELSHEAAVGKIAEEEIEYLMARGLSEEEATAVIVRGFLDVRIMGLPPSLEAEVQRSIAASSGSAM
ncbi:MAG: SufD family Fe-S cluster assembly protein [Syntrophomonadaceae bacterium]|nr:SufD family Fe-S cluster assembly protein [Syntrophomonadaceae bacterium]